jgi:YfiR/HmsC-like
VRRCAKRGAAIACVWLTWSPALAAEQSQASREDQLKAGFIFNFAKFVDWPNLAAADPLTICFIGGAGIRDAFAASVEGKRVGSHPVTARAISARSASGCQLLFVGADAPASSELINGNAVALLSVGEEQNFNHKGGVIELFTQDNRLRFNVNLDNARRAGLKISSGLLQLASHVEEAGR